MSCGVQCQAKTKTGSQCKLNTCKQYPYCWIHQKSLEGLQVKKSTVPGAGEGLFYVGKPDVEAKSKVTLYSAKKVNTDRINGNYVLEVSKNKFLDAEDKSNFVGRYINSTRGTGKQPNVKFSGTREIKEIKNRQTVPVLAVKKIKKDTELLLNYGRGYKFDPKTNKKNKK